MATSTSTRTREQVIPLSYCTKINKHGQQGQADNKVRARLNLEAGSQVAQFIESSLKAPYLDCLHNKIPACSEWIVVKRVAGFGAAMVEVAVEAETEMAVTGADIEALVTAAHEI